MTWLDRGEVAAGVDAGPFAQNGPTKLVLHTTEGSTIEGAIAAYKTAGDAWPHITYDPLSGRRVQHISLDLGARALANSGAPGQTNRAGRLIQVEIVGNAAATPSWPDTWLQAIARDIILPIRAAVGLDRFALRCYGTDAGFTLASETAPQRVLAGDALQLFGGVCGHQHIGDGNDHWDPGGLNMTRLLALTGGGDLQDPVTGKTTTIAAAPDSFGPASTEDDMTPDQAAKLDALFGWTGELIGNVRALRSGLVLDPSDPTKNAHIVAEVRSAHASSPLKDIPTADLLAELGRRATPAPR